MPEADDARTARELADRYWEQLLELEPLLGTEVGDERFDDRLSDPSEAGLAARTAVHGAALAELRAIDRSALEPVTRGTLDMLEAIAKRDLAEIEVRADRLDAVRHIWGPGQILAGIGSLQRADTPERLERYLARLSAVPAYLDAYLPIVEEAAALGQTVPSVVADRTIAQVERLLAGGVDASPALMPLPEGDAAARDRVATVLRDEAMPAHERYLDALRAYRPHATETIGLHAIPNGDAIYASRILGWTTLALDPREVHQLGLDELSRIQEERMAIARSLGHADPASALAEFDATGENVAASREDMVRLAERQVARGWDAAPRAFGLMPSANCEVRPVEEFREKDMPMAFYQSPSADGSRAGVYYVNTSDLAGRPLHQLASTTYHEANPGHHFQITIEQEVPDRPPLRRFAGILAGSAFIEGWGLYSERLADELGLFQNDYERLGMLDAQGWRAARLIVDTAIHALGWDRDRSIDQMVEAGVSRLNAEVEVDRYIALPGQALSYKIGQREIERWRAEAAASAGAAFDLKDFHDRLLALGSLPLPALRREMGSAG